MQYQVFVQSQSDDKFVASVIGMPNLTVEGRTESEAIFKVKSALEAQLIRGKFVTIEVNLDLQPNAAKPQMRYAGIFANDPTFDDFMEKLTVIREESNSVTDVLAVLQALSPEQRQLVYDFAEFLLQKQGKSETEQSASSPPLPPRVFGLHAGLVEISEDFDEPLPDEFWLGENDPLMMTNKQIQQINQKSAS
ncbi:DUF2281 domain-containing protein [Moorena sp. SIO4G3]|uniref:DUF2281 domain-containing protein n=1 Tax=Moorena sp. SIO4G3 TaxID=2607821 RepID=UPI0025E47468|nr:DUF2281 domain-containing protein [Moorena sp. SIO4G3]